MPKERETREITKRLKREGWTLLPNRGKGSHAYFEKKGFETITLPTSKKEVSIGTYRSIAKKAGWITRK